MASPPHGLTLIEDLTFGIIAGCVLAAFALADRVMRSRRIGA
jgi:sulfate permease, SulP family